jgi:hypothetical protein
MVGYYAETAPARFILVDLYSVTVVNASLGILAALRTGGVLTRTEFNNKADVNGNRLRCWIKPNVASIVSYKKTRTTGGTDIYKPAGDTQVKALQQYPFDVPFTALDETFDVFVDTPGIVSLIIEGV